MVTAEFDAWIKIYIIDFVSRSASVRFVDGVKIKFLLSSKLNALMGRTMAEAMMTTISISIVKWQALRCSMQHNFLKMLS